MVNSISSAQTLYGNEAAKPAAPKPQQQQQAQQKTASQPSDTFTLKSTGDVDHDGDSQ